MELSSNSLLKPLSNSKIQRRTTACWGQTWRRYEPRWSWPRIWWLGARWHRAWAILSKTTSPRHTTTWTAAAVAAAAVFPRWWGAVLTMALRILDQQRSRIRRASAATGWPDRRCGVGRAIMVITNEDWSAFVYLFLSIFVLICLLDFVLLPLDVFELWLWNLIIPLLALLGVAFFLIVLLILH